MINTFTGKHVNPLSLRVEDIDIEDIAHSLSQINRFNGHAIFPCSVAQHSVFVSLLCKGTPHELQALLHDASEAYLGDVTKWLKQTPAFQTYREAEDAALALILQKYGCEPTLSPIVEWADRLMVRYEGFHILQPDCFMFTLPDYPPPTLEERKLVSKYLEWEPWPWKKAKSEFLLRFHEIINSRT